MDKVTEKAIAQSGGATALARVLKITRQAIIQWPHVPAKHVLQVEMHSGISRYQLRPDIYGPEPGPLRARAEARVA